LKKIQVTLVNERIKREKTFHDQRYEDDTHRQKRISKYYRISHSIQNQYRDFLAESSPGKRVLEIGCGPASHLGLLTERAASVTSIDISRVALELAIAEAVLNGWEDKTEFYLMDVENLEFPDGSFDIVCGTSILHHLDFSRALSEIQRVLAPTGKGLFIEPLGHNAFLNAYRRLTPAIRSEDEHPLMMKDLRFMEIYFQKVKLRYYYLTAFAVIPFFPLPGSGFFLRILEWIDQLLFRIPYLRRFAWQVLIEVSGPRDH
jgi:ubiquinone/menaquinone biosynthesis C-methylase UbiE